MIQGNMGEICISHGCHICLFKSSRGYLMKWQINWIGTRDPLSSSSQHILSRVCGLLECLAGSHTSPEWGEFPPWRSFGLPAGLNRGWGQAGTAGITLPHRGKEPVWGAGNGESIAKKWRQGDKTQIKKVIWVSGGSHTWPQWFELTNPFLKVFFFPWEVWHWVFSHFKERKS